MAGGRPTKYNSEVLKQAQHYLENYEKAGDVIPNNAALACELHVSRSTIYLWAEEHEEFSDILDDIQATQERVLVAKGLTGDFNSAITKLVMGKHGYHDKADNTLSGPGGGDIKQDIVVEFVGVPK